MSPSDAGSPQESALSALMWPPSWKLRLVRSAAPSIAATLWYAEARYDCSRLRALSKSDIWALANVQLLWLDPTPVMVMVLPLIW